jgi:hypothetical protein
MHIISFNNHREKERGELFLLPVLVSQMLMKNVDEKVRPMWMKILAKGIHSCNQVMSTKKHG